MYGRSPHSAPFNWATSDRTSFSRRHRSTRIAAAASTAATTRSPSAVPAIRSEYDRSAAAIIRRWGSVRSFATVERRMSSHSPSEGNWRRSGFAFQSAERSSNFRAARPLRVSRCLRVSQSRSEGTR